MSFVSNPPAAAGDHQHHAFLDLLPKIRRIARGYFRHVACTDRRHDMVAEVVALGWLWFLQLAARQKDPATFATVFAYTLARAVNSGRRLCGTEKSKDVLSQVCRRNRGLTVSPLPDGTAMTGNVFDDALRDNRRSPVPVQVQFRLDFGRWRASLPRRRRAVLDVLATGERAADVAAAFGLSPGRVSQLRREFHQGWLAFCGDHEEEQPSCGPTPTCNDRW